MDNRILIKHPKNWGLDEVKVRKYAQKALKEKGWGKDVELSLIFVGRAAAKKANIDYRQKDYIPQVLGFPMDREAGEDGYVHLGDIMICTQKLKYEAVFQNRDMDEILQEWLVHGVENLLK